MISYVQTYSKFNFRAAAIIIRGDKVLIHKEERENFWSLPGGRVEWHERTEATLVREMREEIGVGATVDRLVWIVENFYRQEGRDVHEVAFYHVVELGEDPRIHPSHQTFEGVDPVVPLEFRWVPIDELDRFPLFPTFLANGLKSLPQSPAHIVHSDPIERTVKG